MVMFIVIDLVFVCVVVVLMMVSMSLGLIDCVMVVMMSWRVDFEYYVLWGVVVGFLVSLVVSGMGWVFGIVIVWS